MKVVITFLMVITGILSSAAQSSNQSNALATNELQIVNLSGMHLDIRSSFNKREWKHNSFDNRESMAAVLPRQYAFYYVELCQAASVSAASSCDTFRLAPAKRYVIKFTDAGDQLVIRIAK